MLSLSKHLYINNAAIFTLLCKPEKIFFSTAKSATTSIAEYRLTLWPPQSEWLNID